MEGTALKRGLTLLRGAGVNFDGLVRQSGRRETMRDRAAGPFGLGFVALLAILYSFLPRTDSLPQKTSAPPAREVPAPSSAHSDQDDLPLSPLWKFVGCPVADCTEYLQRSGYRVRFLVATVPDPVDSHFSFEFDRAIGAIAGSLSDAGWALDRWRLPWKRPKPGPAPASASSADSAAASGAAALGPGTLLFRNGSQRQLLVVLVAGETPTFGVQKEALGEALDAIANVAARYEGTQLVVAPTDGRVPILGPYFSGAVESLRILLEPRGGKFRIVSGSATSDTNRGRLTFESTSRGTSSIYETTALDDYVLRSHFDTYLRRIVGARPEDEVAILQEELTGYGIQFYGTNKLVNAKTGKPLTTEKFGIPFPLQISQLRSAYDRNEALRQSGAGRQAHRRALEISLEGSEGAGDTLPPYGQHMTANAAELSLSTALETIRRERIRFLGIVASDVRDSLFLARKVRDSELDAILFTFGSDSLYTHPDVAPYRRGLDVVTPYPLVGTEAIWRPKVSVGGNGRRPFSSATEEGIYNAVLTLIDQPALRLDMAARRPGGNVLPQSWITVGGHGGFWPVAVMPPAAGAPAFPLPAGAVALFLSVAGLAVLAAAETWRHRRPDCGPKPGRESLRSYFHPCADDGAAELARTSFLGLQLVLLFMAAASSVWLLKVVQLGSRQSSVGHLVLFTLTGLAVLALLLSGAAASRRLARGRQARLSSASIAGVVFQLFLVVSAYWLLDVATTPPAIALPLVARGVSLASGVSPLLTVTLGAAVLVLWCLHRLRRAVLYEIQGFTPPQNQAPPAGWKEVVSSYSAFMDAVRLPDATLAASVVAFASLVAFRLLFVRRFDSVAGFVTIDGKAFSLVLETLLSAVAFCVLESVFVFLLLWTRLRRVLDALSRSPLADAFNRMPDGFAASPWRMWRTPPALLTLQVAVSHLRALATLGARLRTAGQAPPWMGAGLDRVITHAGNAQTAIDAITPAEVTLDQKKGVRTEILAATAAVWPMLESAWASWPPGEPEVKPEKAGREERNLDTLVWLRRQVPAKSEIWVRIAEEFVAMRAVSFVHYGFAQLRNVLCFALAGFLLALAFVASYPFQPQHPVAAFAWVVGVAGVVSVIWTFVDMERNTILSFIAKTEPGKVTVSLELVTRLLIYGVLPLLTLLATQFPEFGEGLLSVLDPAVRSMR
jgi:hypothetical protein